MADASHTVWMFLTIVLSATACKHDDDPSRDTSAGDCGPLVVASYGGGAWQDSHRKAFFEPFSHITGCQIESVAWDAQYGKLKTDIDSKALAWDLIEVTAAQFVRGKRDGLFEALDTGLLPSDFVDGAVDPYGVANVYWSTVLAYSKAAYASNHPSTWMDFWDTVHFPGPRAMYNDPRGNLEFALLADGVSPRELYPLQVDRAFRALDRIRSSVKVWWEDGSHPVQLLATGQVVMSTAWNGRLFAARRDAPMLDWSWAGAATDIDYWVVPRGARRKPVAQRLLWYASQPHAMAQQAELVGYGPANKRAVQYIAADVQKYLPTQAENFTQGFIINSAWWSENEAEIQRRWIAWKGQ